MEVNTMVLKETGNEFKLEALLISHTQIYLFNIQHRLRELSEMEEIIRTLQKEQNRLERISMTLNKMSKTLEEISERYERAEDLIIDHLDNVIVARDLSSQKIIMTAMSSNCLFGEFHSRRYEKKYLRLINLMKK